MAELNSLLAQQDQIMSSIKRLVPNLKKFGKNNYTRGVLRSRTEILQEYWKQCQEKHQEILSLATAADKESHRYFKEPYLEATEEHYMASLAYLYDALDTLTSTPAPNASQTNRDHPPANSVRLPRIDLPKFSGNNREWENFRDLFESLIDKNDSLSPVQRFHYLKTSLEGEASLLLKNMTVTEANYKSAWTSLKARYDNQRLLVVSHLQFLTNIAPVKSKSASELRRLLDQTKESVTALKNLQRPVEQWDDWIVFITTQKLDAHSREKWELSLGSRVDFPTFGELIVFLEARARAFEAANASASTQDSSASKTVINTGQSTRTVKVKSHHATTSGKNCPVCKSSHLLAYCWSFRRKPVNERREIARGQQCCFNCLRSGHMVQQCPSDTRCRQCQGKHHTLLHTTTDPRDSSTAKPPSEGSSPIEAATTSSSSPGTTTSTVNVHIAREGAISHTTTLLATARVKLRGNNGRTVQVRALLDQGSESSFVTESAAQLLRVPRRKVHITVSGLGGQPANTVSSVVALQIEPSHSECPSLHFEAYVLPRLTSYIPRRTAMWTPWSSLNGLTLADPDFQDSSQVDMLLGADLYASILLDGVHHNPTGGLVAQNTVFGWVLSGALQTPTKPAMVSNLIVHHTIKSEPLDTSLRKFWEVEELPSQHRLSPEDERCEAHFRSTHRREKDGRYTVRLPFTQDPPIDVGDSLHIAMSSLQRLERRLARNPVHAAMYHEFMQEYLRLGHMEPVSIAEVSEGSKVVYLPHHAVFREASTTTRLRVVFNASSRTTNGTSLNDHMLAGPKLQPHLFDIILRWRQHAIVLVADAEKMFRQIWVSRDDADLQRILWRFPSQPKIQAFRLLTVTYGTTAAPYLSLRVLKQLALDESTRYPLASKSLETDVYVDDFLTGAPDLARAKKLQRELSLLLKAGGFNLRKWASNRAEALEDIPIEQQALPGAHAIEEDESIKVLGLTWDPTLDVFSFKVSIPPVDVEHTKRSVLSTIAKLFDPLGWLSPVIVAAKILMQELWLRNIGWDDPVPEDLKLQWLDYCESLPQLQEISVPRFTGQDDGQIACEIHGFADASTRAYAAVVYLRVLRDVDDAELTLLTAKSKVAPVKQLSVPRLELCAAHLLARLIEIVQRTMKLNSVPVHAWTDSAVVLAWLHSHSSRWQTFVANRVADIQTRIPHVRWHHVSTVDNPADCASRGISAKQLVEHPLWWRGPSWLTGHSTTWTQPEAILDVSVDLEERPERMVHVARCVDAKWDLEHRFSSWPKLLRITAYCIRFCSQLRLPRQQRASNALSADEIQTARRFWLKQAQSETFSQELVALQTEQTLPRSSPLQRLNPFLDQHELIRVGGRLNRSMLAFDEKHPVVLPKHRISDLIIAHSHLIALHGGPQLTIRVVRQQYWIFGCRNLVRSHIHRCTKCIRYTAKGSTQLMGNLPHSRAAPSRPFSHSGVDYAGPILVRSAKGRGHKAHKAYIALFVCFATRAIHLELVSDYSTSGFLAAFQRFVSRRGIPEAVYSDNGTNFRGADAELTRAFRAVTRDRDLATLLATDGTSWHFQPPAAPHHGGLWEAGVKTMKHHLRRVIGSHTLTFEELTTFLAQAEACLNSRPLGPLSDDPDDLVALTPGHFLIGAPLKAIPEPSTLEVNCNRLSRWQLVKQLSEQLWRRWVHEYLHSLQQRQKWRTSMPNVQPNELVLVWNELLPPSKWPLGRILQCHPGPDGKVRVVTVRTATTTLTRPITKICPLNIRGSDDDAAA